MECVAEILGHNVEYRAAMPILVLECSKGTHLERRACQTTEIWLFEAVKVDEMD